VEIVGRSVPDVGTMVTRHRLISLLDSERPPLTVVCAAAGYGKTVLVAQIARLGETDRIVWVDLADVDACGEYFLLQVVNALNPVPESTCALAPTSAATHGLAEADCLMRLRESMKEFAGRRVLLVLDGATELRNLRVLENLAQALREYTSPGSRTLVTCRRMACSESLDPSLTWLVEDVDLRFTLEEVRSLISQVQPHVDARFDPAGILEMYHGHPAITRIALRHHAMPDGERHAKDLIWQVRRMVSSLRESEVAALYLAAVLREGRLEDLTHCAALSDLRANWVDISSAVPLFTVSRGFTGVTFMTHAALAEVVRETAEVAIDVDDRMSIRCVALEHLEQSGNYVSLARAMESFATADEISRYCSTAGAGILRYVGQDAVSRLLARVSPEAVAASASMLLLRAHILRTQGSLSDAAESAHLAREMAEANRDDTGKVDAALMLARLEFDRGEFVRSRAILNRIVGCPSFESSPEARCLCEAYLACAEAYSGNLPVAAARIEYVRELLVDVDPGSDEAVFAANCIAGVAADCGGDWASASIVLARTAFRSDVSPVQRVLVRSNYATSLLELCRIAEALPLLEDVVAECSRYGLASIGLAALCTYSEALYTLNRDEEAAVALRQSQKLAEETHDNYGMAVVGISAARSLRAIGLVDESLSIALRSEAILRERGDSARSACVSASIEVAASHLASGDVHLARVSLRRARSGVAQGAHGQSLRCDLIETAIEALSGEAPSSGRVGSHRVYIETGSANLTLVLYLRAFPQLLQILISALGVDFLPARVQQRIGEDDVSGSQDSEASLCRAGGCQLGDGRVPAAEAPGVSLPVRFGGHRLVGQDEIRSQSRDDVCRVRTFGRLEIETPEGPVQECHWRKRKARLLFLMLVSHDGQEVPRDVLMDYLWPTMDPQHALRNFYVTWSTLKRALAHGGPAADAQQYVVCVNGTCRITEAVRSDLTEFREEIRRARSSKSAGDYRGLVDSASRLIEIYAGEFLPSDSYEEWFQSNRSRTRGEFCDVMMAAARCAAELSEHDVALAFLRRASLADPWREDVYQITMQCQMSSGQRSGAIETYNVCRDRLVDDLGIDPCAETTRLFQAVLAMDG